VSRQICDRFNTAEVCGAQTNYLLYAVEFVIIVTTVYCWYLRKQMVKKTRLSAEK
jgi:hypothetical protein